MCTTVLTKMTQPEHLLYSSCYLYWGSLRSATPPDSQMENVMDRQQTISPMMGMFPQPVAGYLAHCITELSFT